jgi:hypothetical protein
MCSRKGTCLALRCKNMTGRSCTPRPTRAMSDVRARARAAGFDADGGERTTLDPPRAARCEFVLHILVTACELQVYRIPERPRGRPQHRGRSPSPRPRLFKTFPRPRLFYFAFVKLQSFHFFYRGDPARAASHNVRKS